MKPDLDDSLPAIETISVPPDAGVLAAIGLTHRFESAVADLVDNSIDAHAGRVLVRFIVRNGLVDSFLVIDDGDGMDGPQITEAMKLGKPKGESKTALGHFGVGLKAASFSQASILTVLSQQDGGSAHGRRMHRERQGQAFACEIIKPESVAEYLHALGQHLELVPRTVVKWDDVRTFPASVDRTVTNDFLEKKQASLRHWLGLTFHRMLEREDIRITIQVFDRDAGESGLPFKVEPIDPFAYVRSGAAGFPANLIARAGTEQIQVTCHIWPAGSDSVAFRLDGANIDRHQGFYLYRNDRLLSAGGWGGVTQERARRRLARASMNIEEHLDLFVMSSEKSNVLMTPDLVRAIESASSKDGVTWDGYLDQSESVFQEANRRRRRRAAVLPPGQGVPPPVKKALKRELTFLNAEEPMRIRWTKMPWGEFVDVDRASQTLWLNERYRSSVLKGARGGVNDAPLLKAMLFLLFEDIFRGKAYGPKDKDNAALWSAVLAAAADAEWEDFNG